MAKNLEVGEWVTLPSALPETNGYTLFPHDMMLVTGIDKRYAHLTVLRTGERAAIMVRFLRRIK